MAKEKKDDSINEDELTNEDKFVEETKSDPDDNREVEPPKKDFGVVYLVTNCIKRHNKFMNLLCLLM